MNVIVTCGPSYEPIDQVRRITNFSTGRLGITLANALTEAGHTVHCLKSEQATDRTPLRAQNILYFSTNDNLAMRLEALRNQNIGAIFHAAALCDFKVASVQNAAGETIESAKFPTRAENLTLILEPTTKILPVLRSWYSDAMIIGWKYEVEGSRDEAIAKGFRQIVEARTDGCVVNGPAFGKDFGFCNRKRDDKVLSTGYISIPDLHALCAHLVKLIQTRPSKGSSSDQVALDA